MNYVNKKFILPYLNLVLFSIASITALQYNDISLREKDAQ